MPGKTEFVTYATNGSACGSQAFPGNRKWANTQLWQVWRGRQGVLARSLLYLDLRYEGGQHGVSGRAYMGRLSVLIAWHEADPVDEHERLRNAVVFSFQGNRNPFIDHPHWVACLHLGECAPADLLFAWGFED
ncbi:MAG: endonuclease [Pseudoxanthomonas sp.]|nr:endonuclease [Pseudoxanthomonas sp.]